MLGCAEINGAEAARAGLPAVMMVICRLDIGDEVMHGDGVIEENAGGETHGPEGDWAEQRRRN